MRMYLTLSEKEFEALRDAAEKHHRYPKQHARHIIVTALGVSGKAQLEDNSDGVRQDYAVAVAG